MKKTLIFTFFIVSIFSSCSKEETYTNIGSSTSEIDLNLIKTIEKHTNINDLLLPENGDFSEIPQDPKNPITQEKVNLGKLLVHENGTGANPRLNSNLFTYACASCHPVASSFYSGNKQGIGEGGSGFGISGEGRIINPGVPLDSVDILPIRVPTLLNVAYQDAMLWDGSLGGTGKNLEYIDKEDNPTDLPDNLLGFQGAEVQGMTGQLAHGLLTFSKFIINYPQYKELFDKAFPELSQAERYTRENGGLAIAAYVRTLISDQAPWQRWLRGDSKAMTEKEKRGATLFMSKGKCYECHNGPALKDNSFHAFGFASMKESGGIIIDEEDFQEKEKGRGNFTKDPNDNYKFKTPTLYNLRDAKFYGHGSSFTSIKSVIEYKNKGVKQNSNVPDSQLAHQFGAINLTNEEIEDITSFILNALYDPNLERYVPGSVLSGLCFPANDSQSKIDLGCD